MNDNEFNELLKVSKKSPSHNFSHNVMQAIHQLEKTEPLKPTISPFIFIGLSLAIVALFYVLDIPTMIQGMLSLQVPYYMLSAMGLVFFIFVLFQANEIQNMKNKMAKL